MENIKYHGALVALRLILLFLDILNFLFFFKSQILKNKSNGSLKTF
jgi:hypothetical protein